MSEKDIISNLTFAVISVSIFSFILLGLLVSSMISESRLREANRWLQYLLNRNDKIKDSDNDE